MENNTLKKSSGTSKTEANIPVTPGQEVFPKQESTDNPGTLNLNDIELADDPVTTDIGKDSLYKETGFSFPGEGKGPDVEKDFTGVRSEETAPKKEKDITGIGTGETTPKKEEKTKVPGEVESVYFHQYDYGANNGKMPDSLLIVQDKDDIAMALVSTADGKGRKKLEFKELTEALHKDSGHIIELFNNKDFLSAALDNFKAGYNQTNLVFDKVYVALKRPQEKIRQWVEAVKEGERAKIMFKDGEIPVRALEKVGIDKKYLDRTQVDKLLRGEQTDLIKADLKTGDIELRDIPPFTIKLERKDTGIEARLTFKKDSLDIDRDKIGKGLSKSERVELIKKGEVKENIANEEGGKTGQKKIVWNRIMNVLERKDTKNEPLNVEEISVTYGIDLNRKQVEHLRDGKKILLDNVLDPRTDKVERAYISLDKNRRIEPRFMPDRTKEKEKSKELKER